MAIAAERLPQTASSISFETQAGMHVDGFPAFATVRPRLFAIADPGQAYRNSTVAARVMDALRDDRFCYDAPGLANCCMRYINASARFSINNPGAAMNETN